MNAIFDNVAELNQVAYKQFAKAGELASTAVEQYAQWGLSQFKAQIEETKANFAAVSAIKDIQDLAGLRSKFDSKVEQATTQARELFDAASKSQAQTVQFFETANTEFHQALVAFVDKSAKTAPAGSEAFVQGLKNALVAKQTATESISKFATDAAAKLQEQAQQFGSVAKAAAKAKK
jgi:Phasin protein